jgi:hypothetical protein
MRSLKQYIVESVHTYNYTIKIAGEVDKNFLDMFAYNLKKFDPIKIDTPKSTPIQKDPYGFPNMSNVPVTIIKCEFRYPATEPMIQQIAQLLGYNVNAVRVVSTKYDDSINTEHDDYVNQMSQDPLLTKEEMGSAPGAKEASDAYGNSYLNSIKDQTKDDKIDIPYEGKKTPDSFDPFKPETYMASMGKESPMSKITRPAKPQTGAAFNK